MAANAAGQPSTVPLGTASPYAVLAGSTITNTGSSVVSGDVGLSPGTEVTGFPPGTVTGAVRTAAAAAPAQSGLVTAYLDAAGRTPATVDAQLGGQTLVPGVYHSAPGTFDITGTLTLDGQNTANAVFILQAASTLTTAAGAPGNPGSQVVLIRGADPCNVFWQVGSSATLGTYSVFQGNILAFASISVNTLATVTGRLLARNGAVTLDTNSVTTPVCSVAPPPTPGSIQVVKNTVNGDGTFAFTSNFGLTFLPTSGGTGSLTIPGLAVGSSYSLTERVPPGWTQTSASCTNGTPAAITVAAGATTTCTITNTQMAVAAPDLTLGKSHAGNFRQGDTADAYTLTVSNAGQGPTTGAVTVSDTLPAGLTATAVGGTGWSCTLTPLTCTRADTLVSGAAYPVITVTVNVAEDPLVFSQVAGSPAFQAGDILISMTDGTVEWRRRDWTLVKVLAGGTGGQAKGLAFDSSGNLYVTHWIGSGSSGNDVMTFDRNGNPTGLFGSGYDCNPSSIVFDNSGNAYVGQADCNTQIFKFDSLGDPLAQYDVAVQSRGSYHIVLDPNQCTMYYTSEGPDVKRFNVCNNTQLADFNSAPLPDPVGGAQQFSLLPGGGMLVADFSTIARLDASGNLVRTYDAPANNCWLGMALDQDGTSFWASNWCGSSVTRFDLATGNVMEGHLVSDLGFMVKQLAILGNIFSTTVTNTAAVAGGGELNTGNDSASDATTINPPAPPTATNNSAGIVNAASYAPTVAAGSIASVLGSGLSSGQAAASIIPLPTALASASFQIGDRAAPLFFVSPSQVNLQIPWELAGQPQASVLTTVGGVFSNQQAVSLAPFAPGLFTVQGAGSSQGTVTIAGTPLFAAPQNVPGSRPAGPGEFLTIYATGLGAVSNQPATGMAAQASPLSDTIATPTVTIGGMAAHVSSSGLAPGAVGLYQVNVQVPAGSPAGDAVPVILSIGGVTSNTGTIAVQ